MYVYVRIYVCISINFYVFIHFVCKYMMKILLLPLDFYVLYVFIQHRVFIYVSFFFYIIVYLTFYDDIVFSQILRFFTLLYLCFMMYDIVLFYFFIFCVSIMYFLDHYIYVCILSSPKYSAVFLYAVRFSWYYYIYFFFACL